MTAAQNERKEAESVRDPRFRVDAANVFLWVAIAFAVLQAVAATYVGMRTWDFRALDANLIDHSWQIELPWRAARGEWSGRDFHYPRGPLWQLLTWISMGPGEFRASAAVTGIRLVAQSVAILLGLVLATRPGVGRLQRGLVLLWVASLGMGAGAETLRSMLSVVHVLLYAPPADRSDASWSRAGLAAAAATAAMLISFDRLVFATFAVLAMTGYEVLGRWRRRQSVRPALMRLLKYATCHAGLLLLLSLVAAMIGASPVAYFAGQRALAAAYAVNLADAADAQLAANVSVFLALALLVAVSVLWQRRLALRPGCFLVGALASVGFALIQPNPGHIYLSVAPTVVVLVVIFATGTLTSRAIRAACGLAAAAFTMAWFGAGLGEVWLSPKALVRAHDVWTGKVSADPGFATDMSRAALWASGKVQREQPRCMVMPPGRTALHALADVPGPTLMAIRWNTQHEAELARAIRDFACDYAIYQVFSFDSQQSPYRSWFLGDDFLALAELYEVEQTLSPATLALRRRSTPYPPSVLELPKAALLGDHALSIPGEVLLPLPEPVTGEDVLRLRYTFSLGGVRTLAGAAPKVEFRFEQDGVPLDAFAAWSDIEVGRAADGDFAPDLEAVEWRFIADRKSNRSVSANSLRVRLTKRGRLSPKEARLNIHGAQLIRASSPPRSPQRKQCDGFVNLYDRIQDRKVMPRSVALRPDDERFLIHPTHYPEALAEVFVPLRPCPYRCLKASVGNAGSSGDGARFEVHVLDGLLRPQLAAFPVAPGEKRYFELPLERWGDRDVLIRFGTHAGDSADDDQMFVQEPEVSLCTARRLLAWSIPTREVRTVRGGARPSDKDILFARSGGRLEYSMRVIPDTCLSYEFVVRGSTGAVELRTFVAQHDILHRLDNQILSVGEPSRRVAFSLHDFRERPSKLVLDVTPIPGAGDVTGVLKTPTLGSCAQ